MTEPILEQEQIDQLIEAIHEGRIATKPDSLAHVAQATPLDLRNPSWNQDRIIRRRLPVLELVFDRLGPSLQVTLTKGLRSPVRAEGSSVVLQKFGDFRRQFDGRRCIFQVVRLDPLRGYSMVVMSPTLTYALIDASMGGLGIAEVPEEREISDIEVGLLYRPYMDLLRDFENAWKSWFPLRVENVRSDRDNQVSSTLSDEEICHIGTIKISGDVLPTSPIHFILPYTSLEPLLEATSARAGDDVDPNWRVHLHRSLMDVEAEATAVLGETEIPAERVRALAEGDVIELDHRPDQDIDVRVEGEPIFRGRLGKSHLKYAVRISGRRRVERTLVDRTNGQILVRKGLISHEQLAVAQVDELINRRPLLDSIVSRGWVERRVLEAALGIG
ncbi:MAG: flagellar motor switch protein FliM [Myxococcota bacterium]